MLEFMALNLLRLSVFVYKSTPDSTNLGSLGCGMLTVALPHSSLCVLFSKWLCLVLPCYISCELGELTVVLPQLFSAVLEAIQILLSFGTKYQQVMSAEYNFLDFSIYLFDLPLSICRKSIKVSFVNLISRYLVRTNLTLLKVVVQAALEVSDLS